MTANTSSAVMQQRSEPHDSLDDYPTPPWATRALCEWLRRIWCDEPDDWLDMTCREPAANRGHMVRPLREYFGEVVASDVHDYGAGFPVQDYLFPGPEPEVDWTITNPPFRLAEQFIARAEESSRHGFAMIVRSAFLEGEGRYKGLFSINPPSHMLQFTERVVMHRGALRQAGSKYIDDAGNEKSASTATAYCWLVWMTGCEETRLEWIAPCRKRLERDGDYPAEPQP
jgi:hypothetical protein